MIEYGVTTSKAHYWVHVCPLDASLYCYGRRRMAADLERFERREIRSAIGHLVPVIPNLISNGGLLRAYDYDYPLFKRWDWQGAKSDRALGAMAEALFENLCSSGQFALPVRAERYDEQGDQFQGKDFACSLGAPRVDVEVKADVQGGIWGTGNLFVQTHELHHRATERLSHRQPEATV